MPTVNCTVTNLGYTNGGWVNDGACYFGTNASNGQTYYTAFRVELADYITNASRVTLNFNFATYNPHNSSDPLGTATFMAMTGNPVAAGVTTSILVGTPLYPKNQDIVLFYEPIDFRNTIKTFSNVLYNHSYFKNNKTFYVLIGPGENRGTYRRYDSTATIEYEVAKPPNAPSNLTVNRHSITPYEGESFLFFSWNAASKTDYDLSHYEIYFDVNSNFTNAAINRIDSVTATSVSVKINDWYKKFFNNQTSLQESDRGKILYCKIRAIDTQNNASSFSEPVSVAVNKLPQGTPTISPNPLIANSSGQATFSISGCTFEDNLVVTQSGSPGLSLRIDQVKGYRYNQSNGTNSVDGTLENAGQYTLNFNKSKSQVNFFGWDGLEAGEGIASIPITFNEKPIVQIDSLKTSLKGNLVSINAYEKCTNKTKQKTIWYIRAASTESGVTSATSYVINTNNSSTYGLNMSLSIGTYGLVYSGYFQIGVKVNDGIEDSELIWSDIQRVNGLLTTNLINITLSNSDNSPNGYEEYFYKKVRIGFSFNGDAWPEGYDKLYYNIFYSLDGGSSWTSYYSTRQEKQQSSNTNDFSYINITFSSVYSVNTTLLCKVVVYDAIASESQKIEKISDESFIYATPFSWSASYTSTIAYVQLSDNRNEVRPNYKNPPSNIALNIESSIPNSVCRANGTETDLKWSLSFGDIIIKEETNITESQALSGQILFNLTYDDLAPIFNNTDLLSYNSDLILQFTDVYGRIFTRTLTFKTSLYEKPTLNNTAKIGYIPVAATSEDLLELLDEYTAGDTVFPNEIISLPNEFLVIDMTNVVQDSYNGQVIGKYYVDLYKGTSLLETFTFTDTYKNRLGTSESLIIYTSTIFTDNNEYTLKLRVQDSAIYNGNISDTIQLSQKFFGCSLITPILSLNNIGINFTSSPKTITCNTDSLIVNWGAYNGSYERIVTYGGMTYSPTAIYTIEGSLLPSFDSENTELILPVTVTDYTSFESFSASKETVWSDTKAYIRGKLTYSTRLIYDNSEIREQNLIVYSNILLGTGEEPTVSHRKNAVGINGAPNKLDNNACFTVQGYGGKKRIIFAGNDNTNAAQLNTLVFDLGTGQLTKFGENNILVPTIWFVSPTDIESLIESLTF